MACNFTFNSKNEIAGVNIENTKFIFGTHFEGDPAKDKYHSTKRYGNIIIPDPAFAEEMRNQGFNVKHIDPDLENYPNEDPAGIYYVSIIANMDSSYPPKIYMISGIDIRVNSEPIMFDADSLHLIDTMRVENVDVFANQHTWDEGKTLYIRTMYVTQCLDDDPYYNKYHQSVSDN